MEAGVDEANAYTYATLFFLGRFLAMTALDRLPVSAICLYHMAKFIMLVMKTFALRSKKEFLNLIFISFQFAFC